MGTPKKNRLALGLSWMAILTVTAGIASQTGCKPMSWGERTGANSLSSRNGAPLNNLSDSDRNDTRNAQRAPSLWDRLMGRGDSLADADISPEQASIDLPSDTRGQSRSASPKIDSRKSLAQKSNTPNSTSRFTSEEQQELEKDIEAALADGTPEQRDLLQRQYEALKQLGLEGDPLAEPSPAPSVAKSGQGSDTEEKSSGSKLVSLPPANKKNSSSSAKPSNALPNGELSPVNDVRTASADVNANADSAVSTAAFRMSDSSPASAVASAEVNVPNAANSPINSAANNATTQLTSLAPNNVPASASSPIPLLNSPPANFPTTNGIPGQLASITNGAAPAPANLLPPNSLVPPQAAPGSIDNQAASIDKEWKETLHQTVIALEKRLADNKDLSVDQRRYEESVLRMLYVAQRRQEESARPISALSPAEQQYFVHQLQSFYEAINPERNPAQRKHYSLVMNSQRKADQFLSALSDLEVRNVALCSSVESFGQVTKFPKYEFKADQPVLLYCELENFSCVEVPKEGFQTAFKGTYEIFDMSGMRIDDKALPVDEQTCRNRRRDYFIAYRIYLPKAIQPGKYKLKLTIEDTKEAKWGHSEVDFTVVQ